MSGIRHLSAFLSVSAFSGEKINCLIQETYKKAKKHTREHPLLSEQGVCFFLQKPCFLASFLHYISKAEQAPKQSIVP